MGYPAFNLTIEQLSEAQTADAKNAVDLALMSELSSVAQSDLDRWQGTPRELQDQVLGQMRSYLPPTRGKLDGPCIWLGDTTRLCSHHQHRPQVCRDFRVGGEGCLDWRKEYSVV